ncbi:MAG: nucleoside deaminase [Pseudolabrys sp.]
MKAILESGNELVNQSAIDLIMMRRCIQLSASSAKLGEFPFAAVISAGDKVVVEATNQVTQNTDVTRHAELVAISEAQRKLGRKDLSNCTLYSTVEPCPMCSFPIRETRINRVVFAISSPLMGGYSKWNVLRDMELFRVMPEVFGPPPELVAGLMRSEAEKVWRRWNPVIWAIIKYRGVFGSETAPVAHLPALNGRGGFLGRFFRARRHKPRPIQSQ